MPVEVVCGDCVEWLRANREKRIHLTFLDPPFRQGKNYRYFNDNMPEGEYWKWIEEILSLIHDSTVKGGAIYFMHREKNTEFALKTLRESGWNFKNLIIWKK
ncbi:site-specific DNA-methyltransferase, partial [Candidatus Geothermarchaeota archaeon]